ncbi:MAG: Cof-type HAD-IIB family hydrolase [Treponema sp.]|nr:Cof-type HAD-IIB family hydrolase [Treponema sp.]
MKVNAGNIKVIVCDLDGTLLNNQKLISPGNLRAVNAARERGIFVTICTGRIPEMTEAYIRFLGIQGPVIMANGAAIIDTRDNSVPYRECSDNDQAAKLLEFCAERGFDHIAAAVEGCYYSRNSKRIERFTQYNSIAQKENMKQMSLVLLDDYSVIKKLNIYKLLIAGLSKDQQNEVEAYVETLPDLGHTSSEQGLLDVGAAEVNKGNGVRNLARVMGISADEICVFGDFHNDVPMFEAAVFSVAMGNADESVKKSASYITKTNDEDGVAAAIEKYFLGG